MENNNSATVKELKEYSIDVRQYLDGKILDEVFIRKITRELVLRALPERGDN